MMEGGSLMSRMKRENRTDRRFASTAQHPSITSSTESAPLAAGLYAQTVARVGVVLSLVVAGGDIQ
jgi:hypothetical protein